MKTDKVELLAPAGSMDALIAAVNNGADAIYLGGMAFGARAFANNFNHDDLIEAVNFCHLRNVFIYVTMNTLLYENEISKAMEEVDFLYNINVDALIIQDLGLFNLVNKMYPDFEIHCSTQMHIHNAEGAKFMMKKGASRVVLARETHLNIIEEVVKTGVDVEIFSYGALCMSYSGQCLMSSILQGRSGNRGVCAQHCRLPYKLIDNDTKKQIDTFKYLLSPKDLNLLDNLSDILSLNVKSLKIEGRMKRSEYVGLTVKIFRKAIDTYYEGKAFKLSEEELNNLKLMFNRGFTDGKINNADDKEFMNPVRPNHIGLKLGKVVGFNKKYIEIKLDREVHQGDGIRILSDYDDHGLILNKIFYKGKLVNKAEKGAIISIEKRKKVNINDEVVITTDINLNTEVNKNNQILHNKIALNAKVFGKVNEPLTLIIYDDNISANGQSDFILQVPLKTKVDSIKIVEQINKTNDTPYIFDKIEVDIEDIFIPIKFINELRRNVLKKYISLKLSSYKKGGKKLFNENIKSNILTKFKIVEINNKNQFYALNKSDIKLFSNSQNVLNFNSDKINYLSSVINENSIYLNSSYSIISELGMMNKIDSYIIANYSFNVTNSYALSFLLENGCDLVIYSLELNSKQIKMIEDSFIQRLGFSPNTATMVYGKRDLMITKQRIVYEGVEKRPGKINLSHSYSLINDKKQKFTLFIDDMGFTHILENEAFRWRDEILTPNLFYRFTDEDLLINIRRVFNEKVF